MDDWDPGIMCGGSGVPPPDEDLELPERECTHCSDDEIVLIRKEWREILESATSMRTGDRRPLIVCTVDKIERRLKDGER